jgi:TolA-binding protein
MYFRNTAALLLLATIGVYTGASAQQTESFRSEYRPYYDAHELMGHAQYEAARKGFESFLDQQSNQRGELYVNAAYYRALCTMKLFHKDGERLMSTFILDFPESVWLNPAVLELGRYNFNRRDFKDSYYYFNELDIRDLNTPERDEVKFKLGFSAFELGKVQEARGHFYELKDKQGEYYGATNYYYGHIAYTEGNYQTALESFERAATDEKFAAVVPYYIVHIYHYQQKYDELITYAQPMLDSTSTGKKEEIARLLGNAYYQKQDYVQAQPFLELYMTRPGTTTPEDNYQVAYTYYRNKEYKKSIDYFAKATPVDNKLGQVATYQMADAYVQMGERKYAQNAFRTASQMDHDPEVTEDALFNYAKLAYELSYDPFHEAIQAFERYLNTYPNSSRKDEAYAFLLKVHLSTKNYKAAIGAIDKMKAPTPVDKANFQLSAYNYAVQEMRKGNNDEALTYFKLAKKYREDAGVAALADYWTGDLMYRKGEYPKAIDSYNTFLANTASVGTDYFNTANYNIGYCHFKTGEYGASLTAFRKFTSSQKENPKRRNDALLRIGDLHLVNKEYDLAIKSYQEALTMNVLNGDYALYNIGMAYGYQEQFDKKTIALNDMLQRFPETSLAPVARYELGDTYFLQNKLNEALTSLNIVINDFGQSPYRKKALLKRGLVQYRMSKYDEAIASYKQVVSEYGVDSESKEAIAVLRSIYLDLGKIDEYTAWLNKVPNYSISPTEIDSLTYQAAENLIADSKCTEAISAFDNYLKKFPNGLFANNANYYQADCAYRQNNFDLAIKGFEYVAAQPVGKFSESALYGAAAIRFSRKEYSQALGHYEMLEQVATFASNKLEAQLGRMRCHYQLGSFNPALDAANQVIHADGATEAFITEARLLRGKIRLDQKNYVEARTDFSWLAENSKADAGAEAKFRLGLISLEENKLEEAENHVFELVKNFGSYEYWKVEGFMLLAEVYIVRKDYFQARATLQSVADNVEDQSVVNRAKARLKDIENAEAAANKPATDTSPEDEEYNKLIDDK